MKEKLTPKENFKRIIKDTIEKELFNTQKLEILKDIIHKVSAGEISTRFLKETILDTRADILERLVEELSDIFDFHTHQITTQLQLSESTSNMNSQLETELQQKNKLIQKVVTRVNNIYEKIQQIN